MYIYIYIHVSKHTFLVKHILLQNYGQIVPTPCGSTLQASRASYLPCNAKNQVFYGTAQHQEYLGARRVVRTPSSCCNFRTSFWISTLRLEILPEIWLHVSYRFKRELTECQFSQRSRYPGNPRNATTLSRNLLFRVQMSLNACPGRLAHHIVCLPLGPPAGTQDPTKILQKFYSTNIAERK